VDRNRRTCMSRIEPIGTPMFTPLYPLAAEPPGQDRKAAEAEVASLWYVSTLQTMQDMDQKAAPKAPQKTASVESKESEQSFFSKIGNWLWGTAESLWNFVFPTKQGETVAEDDKSTTTPLDHTPKLQTPDMDNKRKLSLLVADLNRELVTRLKEIAEFEEEMRKSNSNKMDKLIFIQLVASSLAQRKLREEGGIEEQESLFELHKKNKDLQKAYYNIQDEINRQKPLDSVLHWVSIGATAGIMGSLALTVFTGGVMAGALAFALPLSYLAKGAVTATQGILGYKTDIKIGKMTMVNHEIGENSGTIDDKMTDLQMTDQNIAELLKAIRQVIENHGKAERASFKGS
jgi:hypothetical protein